MDTIQKQKAQAYIRQAYMKIDTDIVITPVIERMLFSYIDKALETRTLKDFSRESIIQFVKKNTVIDAVKDRQPNIAPIEENVVLDITDHFKRFKHNIYPLTIFRMSNNPIEKDLYGILGMNIEGGDYCCFTLWNADEKILNQGHFGFDSYDDARICLGSYFRDITEDTKYGLGASSVEIEDIGIVKTKIADLKQQYEMTREVELNSAELNYSVAHLHI